MIRIAFCDDDVSVLDELSALLDRYHQRNGCDIICSAYHSPFDLMTDVERGMRWDIYLLDVIMPGESGMELAREIRQRDEHAVIIFLTSSPEFAVESYAVGAFFYQLKPVNESAFFPVLTRAIAACRRIEEEHIILKCKTGIVSLSSDQLEYCEAVNRALVLHLTNGKVLESTHKMDEMEEKLYPLGCFLRVHRSYLVNMNHIDTITYRAVTMRSLIQIPVPHGKYNHLKAQYLCYAFEKEQVVL